MNLPCFYGLALLLATLPVAARLGTPDSGTPAGLFGPATTYAVGYQPRALVLADVNGDGRLDILTANEARSRTSRGGGGDNYAIGIGALLPRLDRSAKARAKDMGSVSVLLGQAAGGFGPARDVAVGPYPTNLVVGDVTHDGHPDLVVACDALPGGHTLLVLPGQAGGTFSPATTYSGPYLRTAELLALADLNADGWPDMLTANDTGEGGHVQVQLNLRQPASPFGPADSTYLLAQHYSPRSLALADVTGDGRPDAVITNGEGYYLDSTIVVLPGRANGRFGQPLTYLAGLGPTTLGDLNHDGRPDLVAAGSHALVVWLGGPHGLGPATRYPGVGHPLYSLRLADVNGDGHPDLLANYYPTSLGEAGTVAVLPGRPAGGFGPPTTYQFGDYSTEHFTVGDVNGDGRPDLVVLSRNGNSVSVRLGQ